MKVQTVEEWTNKFKQNNKKIKLDSEKESKNGKTTFFVINYGNEYVTTIAIFNNIRNNIKFSGNGVYKFMHIYLDPNNVDDNKVLNFFDELGNSISKSIDHGMVYGTPVMRKVEDGKLCNIITMLLPGTARIENRTNDAVEVVYVKNIDFASYFAGDCNIGIQFYFGSLACDNKTGKCQPRLTCTNLWVKQKTPIRDESGYVPDKEHELVHPSVYGYGLDLSI